LTIGPISEIEQEGRDDQEGLIKKFSQAFLIFSYFLFKSGSETRLIMSQRDALRLSWRLPVNPGFRETNGQQG
jgi:hypothetical protein